VQFSGGAFRDLQTDSDNEPLPPPPENLGDCGKTMSLVDGVGANPAVVLRLDNSATDEYAFGKVPMAGDQVAVIWSASSGGKTQQLFKYTVQSDSPDF
jgi:hypothetical protein